jgi:hypothetical protein
MTSLLRSRTLSISIARTPADVYAFVSNPETLPQWAPGFCLSVRRSGPHWTVETPAGPMRFRFAAPNDLGVLDHYVTPLPDDVEMLNPMRVVPNAAGSELMFTLFQAADMSDEAYARDLELVQRDLAMLKTVLEDRSASR